MSAEHTTEERFARYLEARENERREARNAAIRAMTEDERKLLHNAAVMGFVHGNMHGSARPNDLDRFPTDLDIIVRVLDACATQEDRSYPFLAPLMKRGERPRTTWAHVGKAARAVGFTAEVWMPGQVHWGRRDEQGAIQHEYGWVTPGRPHRSRPHRGPVADSVPLGPHARRSPDGRPPRRPRRRPERGRPWLGSESPPQSRSKCSLEAGVGRLTAPTNPGAPRGSAPGSTAPLPR
jgi:hypothetical protein